MKILLLLLVVLALCNGSCWGQCSSAVVAQKDITHQNGTLRQKLEHLVQPYRATIGVAIVGIEDGDTVTINNEHHYPMQSAYKFPLAMAVLHQVDQGKLSLIQKVHISKKDIRPTWSPMRTKYPKGNVDLTVGELLEYTVAQSDNNSCDVLFRLVQGTENVERYIRDLGIQNMAITATEEEMSKHWEVQYTNWTTPLAMAQLLDVFYQKKPLSETSSAFLTKIMTESANSSNRIKGLLPVGTVVAHKTGTSDTNERGKTAATNDVGIITLPNGKHIAIAVFVSDSMETHETNEKIIADIAKTTFDYFTEKGK